MKKKRVLIVGSDISVKGGITTVIKQYLNNNFENVEISYLPTYIEGNFIKKILFFIKNYFIYIEKLIFNKFDISHVHMSYKGSFYRKLLILLVSKLFNKKVIIHLHGSEFQIFYNNSNRLIKRSIRFLLRNSDAFLVLGDNWKEIIKFIEPRTSVYVLKNSVSVPNYTVELRKDKFNILFLGVLIKRKGIYDLIESIKIISQKGYVNKYNLNFIIGGIGPEETNIKNLIKKYKLNSCIEMLGWVDGEKKQELLENSQLFILPSYNEGLPMSILEAMSYGIPTISTDVGSINEAIIHGETGYLIKPSNNKQLCNYLIDIVENEEKWKIFNENSKKIIIENFNQKIYFKNIEKIYFEVMYNN